MRYSRLIIIICVIASIAAWAVFIVPQYFKFQDVQREINTQKSYLDNQTKYYQQLKDIYDKLAESPDQMQKIDIMIPNEMDYASLVNFFNTTGRETGVLVQSVTVGNQSKMSGQDRIKENNVFLTLIGTYASFKNFLTRIENNSRLLEIDDISFASAKTETGFFNYNIKIRTYSY